VTTSAGRALTERQEAEHHLATHTTGALDSMLADMRTAAYGALRSPVLLASGETSPNWAPFTLGTVLARWGQVVASIIGSITNVLGAAHQPGDLYLTQTSLRLLSSQLPGDIYESVRAVLKTSQAENWSAEQTENALINVLAMNTPAVAETAGDSPGTQDTGVTWQAQAERIARTEATSAVGHRTVTQLAATGTKMKRWVAHHDNLTRPEHLAADGQTVPTTSSFEVAGYRLMFPGDPSAPTFLTANCRCTVIGVTR
jgi:hypothetical protein